MQKIKSGVRQTSRTKDHRKKQLILRRRKLIAAMLAVILVPVGAVLIFLATHPLYLKHDIIYHELAEKFDPADNIRFVFGGEPSEVEIDNQVDISKVGEYPVIYTYKRARKETVVKVEDTTPPELSVRPYTTDLAEKIDPEMFIEQVRDASEVRVSFDGKKEWGEAGAYDVRIVAEDASGNRTVEKTKLIRKKDETPPVLAGIEDVTVMQGRGFDFEKGVSVSDDMDAGVRFQIDHDSVDLNTPGIYKAVYTAADRSGNQAVVERTITVERDPELGEKIVFLTFDDGPSGNTGEILDILKKFNAKATFFVTGNNREYDKMMKRAHDEGHAVGLHTYTHNYKEVYASKDAYFKDLQKISDLVEKVTGEKSMLIRFPGGSSNTVSAEYTKGIMTELTKEVQERGYQYFDWNCDSTDAAGNNVPVETLVKNATSGQGDHINILMHDTDAKDTTVKALADIIKYYRGKGYSFRGLTVNSDGAHHGVNN